MKPSFSFRSGVTRLGAKSSVSLGHIKMGAGEQWSPEKRHLQCSGQTQQYSTEFIGLVSASALLKQAAAPAWGERNGQQPWKAIKRAGGAGPRTFFK